MRFSVGQIVQLCADPSRRGPIIEIMSPVGGMNRYRVYHSAGNTQEYFEDQIQLDTSALSRTSGDLETALNNGDYTSADIFRARITAERLSNPQSDSIYSLRAARIQYVPFQFKPLLRFFRADQPRLLIADEVGVGKTIEAGLILREMQTRQDVENVLIVCPKALVFKWRTEMKRFDEEFRVLTPEILRYCIKETHLDGTWPSQHARGIVSLELLRMAEEYLDGKDKDGRVKDPSKPVLFTLDPPPHFSLVIFDEAHHLRNQETNSHKAARFLCDISEAVLFLSATPVHLGSKNLYTLLSLLRPDVLQDFAVYELMMEPNAHLIRSMRHIRTRMPGETWQSESLSAIKDAVDTEWGRQALRNDPRVVEWTSRLSCQEELGEEERIRFLRDLEEVHTFSHMMNRTRRRDIGQFTIREPHTEQVSFTPDQMKFYEALIDFRQQVLSLEHDPRAVRLITVNTERQASSCLPALLPMLDNFIRTGRFISTEHTDNLEDEEAQDLPAFLVEEAKRLRDLAANLPPDDPKLERLKELTRTVLADSRPRKVLIFSYFLHTLAYLNRNLSNGNMRVGKITSHTDDDDRERLRDRFRLPHGNPDSIDVLLSSEVGYEGLDYEFCDCLVNYDIPWNPMKIEQRIGRIDRFGQQSDKVHIYNFITPGTVEERIIFRCFERLDIFRNTVGDSEDIFEDVPKKLKQIAYDPDLSPEQATERAMQMSDNALRKVEEQRRLEENSEALLGLEQSFIEEVDSLIEEGRFVAPDDLAHMIKFYVEQDAIGGRHSTYSRRPLHHQLRLNENARDAVLRDFNALNHYGRAAADFRRWLVGSEPRLSLTYDSQTAMEQRDFPFITPIHPLAKVAINHWKNASKPLVAKLSLRDADARVGSFFFALELWETLGVHSEVRLKTFAWDLDRQKISTELSSLLPRLTHVSDLHDLRWIQDIDLHGCFEEVDRYANSVRLNEVKQLKLSNDNLLDRKLASLSGYYGNRLSRVANELELTTNERIRIMRQSEANRIEAEFQRKQSEIQRQRNCDIIANRIAVGIIRIQPD